MEQKSVTTPDLEYWKSQIKCQAACPVHTDARGYVRAIADGDFKRAYLIARGPNPLASICGRVCGAPCESACRRGDFDQPIAIRALKRFVCERYGSESYAPTEDGEPSPLLQLLKEAAGSGFAHECEGEEELLPLMRSVMDRSFQFVDRGSVGIIGSGPAGLAAAHDLALFGFDVTIYELEPVLAGMLAVGIPEYRLPRDLIRQEVDVIRALGVKAVVGCEVGRDVSFVELRNRHDFLLVAVGAKRSRSLPIPGVEGPGVRGGVEFLRDVAVGEASELGHRVVVIGGGNVAYDIGRTVLRQISYDAARAARRQDGDTQVTLCSLESLEEMPADDVEIIEGDEEGIIRRNSMGPVEILRDEQGQVRGVVFQKCVRVFDEAKRFAPVFDETQRETIECDSVLLAVGQTVDLSFIDAAKDELELDARGFLVCDAEAGTTSAPDIFVAGDLAYGTKLLIHAVASGKRVARSIYKAATGREIDHESTHLHLALPEYQRERDYERRKREHVPVLSASERLASQSTVVETGYDEETARREAARCLDCGVNTIFDGQQCILCGGCVDVCPSDCLLIVSADRLGSHEIAIDELAESVLDRQLGDRSRSESSVIVKDETICIRCALCAERCPTGAITMERFFFGREGLCPAV